MADPIDLLQIRIDKAKSELPQATREAIEAVDWKAPILGMRASKGYSFEQLGNLELETELVLCGLVTPEDYPRELEKRMGISRSQADALVEEMNQLVFSKIREELIKNSSRKEVFSNKQTIVPKSIAPQETAGQIEKHELDILHQAGIKLATGSGEEKPITAVPKQDFKKEIHPLVLGQKLSTPVQTLTTKTEHTAQPVAPATAAQAKTTPVSYPPKSDPYRERPE